MSDTYAPPSPYRILQPTYLLDANGQLVENNPTAATAAAKKPEKEPSLADRFKQGVGRAADSAQVALSGNAGVIADVAARQQRDALPQTALQKRMEEELEPYAEAAKNAQGVVDSVRAWAALGGKRAGQLISNPAEAGKMIAEQLPNSIPGMVGGLAGAKGGAMLGSAFGPAGTLIGGIGGGFLGGFAGGYGLEKGGALIEQTQEKAQQQGVNLQDKQAAKEFVSRNLDEFDATASRKAVGTAGTDAALNVLTMGVASMSGRAITKEAQALAKRVRDGVINAADASATLARLEAANAARNTIGRKAMRGGAVVGAEMLGEGGSEAVGQKYAYGEVDPKQVIDEALLGLGQGGAMAIGGKAFRKAAGLPDNDDAATRSLDDVHAAFAKNRLVGGIDVSGLELAGASQPSAAAEGAMPEAPAGARFNTRGLAILQSADGAGLPLTDTQPEGPTFPGMRIDTSGLQLADYPGAATGPQPAPPEFDTGALAILGGQAKPSELLKLRTREQGAGPLENVASQAVDAVAPQQAQAAQPQAIAEQSAANTPSQSSQSSQQPVSGTGQARQAASPLQSWTDAQLSMLQQTAQAPEVRTQIAAERARRATERQAQTTDHPIQPTIHQEIPNGTQEDVGAVQSEISLASAGSLSVPNHAFGTQADSIHGADDSGAADAKRIANLARSHTSDNQVFKRLDADGLGVMQRHMLRISQNPEILNTVVKLIPVNVVNMLRSKQLAPEMLFHDPSVLTDSLVGGNSDHAIAVPVDAAASVMNAVARVTAKNLSLFEGGHFGGLPVNGSAANNAGVKASGANSIVGGRTSASRKQSATGPAAEGVGGAIDLRRVSSDGSSTPVAFDSDLGGHGSHFIADKAGVQQQSNGENHEYSPNQTQQAIAQPAQTGAPQGQARTPDQIRRERLEREISTGKTNNGGVIASLRPSAIEKRKQELAAMGEQGKTSRTALTGEQVQGNPSLSDSPAASVPTNAAQNQAQAPAAPQQTPTWATMPPEDRQQVIQAAGLNKPQATKALATNSIEEMPAAIADKLAPVLSSAAGSQAQAQTAVQGALAAAQTSKQNQPPASTQQGKPATAEANPFADYNALAQQYGYEVRPDGAIGSDGKFPGPKMKVKGGRLRIESGSGDFLASYASATPQSLGKFLESFWYAEKKAQTKSVEQAAKDSEKARLIQATLDRSRLNGSSGVQIAVAPNGGIVFNGDPNSSKDARALRANYEEALKAGATPAEIAAALTAEREAKRSAFQESMKKPAPASAEKTSAATENAVPPALEPRRVSSPWVSAVDGWETLGEDGTKDHPGFASEKSARIAISKNPEWGKRNPTVLPFEYNDGSYGMAYSETRTRYVVVAREREAAPTPAKASGKTKPNADQVRAKADLMKTRAHAKTLIDAGKLDAQAAQAAWTDHEKLLALLDAQEQTNAATQPEAAKASSTKSDSYGSKNTLVSQSRAEELRAKLREKAKNNLFGGLDTEMMAWGTELAVFHLEAGVRKFSDLVAAMASDLGTTPAKLKPYLRSWYNGARDMMEDHGLSIEGMDSPDAVRAELAKIDDKPAQAATMEAKAAPATESTNNANSVSGEQLSQGNQAAAADDAATGNGNSQPLDDGLAKARASADSSPAADARADRAGGSGADSVQRTGEPASGPARDSAAVRTDGRGADPVSKAEEAKQADPATAEESAKPELDHTIDAEDIGKGGLTKKYRDNIAAIRVLKAMAADGRKATPDERKAIARYVGWGALKGVFDKDNKQWGKEFAELRELLTDAEYKAARASTLNAHFTSPDVVKGIFTALERMGFTRGRIMEPSVGVGNFFGLMPASMRKGSQLHGVELDPLTSQIVAALYPSAKIAQATGFQDFDVPGGYFDAAIGNPPFGSEPIVDDARSPYSGFSIHNYFFAKSIDKLRPGGLMAMVVSHNFLDAKDETARRWIADRANLVSAVRLPNTAFKENAGTEVVTDIVVFQRKTESEQANGLGDDSWVKVGSQSLTDPKTGAATDHNVSQYFLSNPANVMGTPTAAGSMYRAGEYTVEPSGKLTEQLGAWAEQLPKGIYQAIERTHEKEAADVVVPDGVKVGSFFVDDKGTVQMRGNDVMGDRTANAWTAPNAKAQERMVGMVGLRDALRTQMRLERSPDATEAQIEDSRRDLNEKYDAFHKAYGFVNDQTNRRIFLDDTESALLLALEFDYDRGVSKAMAEKEDIEARGPSAKKADIFSRRVMFPPADNIKVSTAHDALLASLNYKGRLDLPYMSSLYADKSEADIIKELGDMVFTDPLAGLVMADEYLSGDVKTKLVEAEAAALDDAAYKRNVEALKKVIPADKKPSEIHAALGANFMPAEYFEQFAKEMTGATAKATYVRATGQWIVNFTGEANSALDAGKWGIAKMPARSIFLRTMAGQGVVVTETRRNADGSTTTVVLEKETAAAREKQAAMKAEWQRWLWSDPDRADKLAGIYNEKMNRVVVRAYDGSHLTFPGMSPAMELLPHQKNAVWRALQSRQVLLDHVVGAGKTFEVVALFMEMRRLGIARKPFIAVPNHLTLQWRSEFSRLYPAANVLAATPDDFKKENREKFFSKIVTGDWDAVIVGHSSLKKIALPPETEKAILQEQIDEIASAIEEMKRGRGDRNIVRDMEGIKARLEARMKARLQAVGDRDKVVTFDELGVDAFGIDELHEFKNLFYNSTMERVPGMGNPTGSDKAFDLFVKLQWMFETYGEKAPIAGATGTPVSNSLVEMFNMQRFMQYPALKRDGLHVFDAWAKQYGSVESLYEVSPSGTGYRQSSRFAKFKNLPALMASYGTFADTVTLDDLKAQEEARGKAFPVPKVAGGRPQNVVAKRSPMVANFMGVPQLDIQGGKVQFGFPVLTDKVRIQHNAESGMHTAIVTGLDADDKPFEYTLGSAKTEEDARLMVVEAALSPKIKVDPNSILGQFADLKRLNKETKGKVNALSLTGQANKAGLDYRLIDPSAPDFDGSKINLAVDRMMATYQKWGEQKGAQLVFCDLSVPLSARSGFSAKERRVYVREQGQLVHKKGTLHTVNGHEQLPFLVVKDGGKDGKSYAIYDAATGLRLFGNLPNKSTAIDWAAQALADEGKRQRWIDARDELGDIEQDAIDDYNNANEINTEESEAINLEDIAGVSGAQGFSVYDDIKAKLLARGVPEREIAFIHDFGTPAAKDKLFKQVKRGDVRFLLGSTPKMGAGTNVQDQLVGLHHIDAPWRPSDLEQREGRIIRRGNKFYEADPEGFEVEIYRYATEQTYDTRRWQILEHKARGIEQLRNYDGSLNEIDDIEGEAANSADMKAAASGDPLILEETRLRNDVRRLETLQASHADETQGLVRRARDQQRFADKWGPRDLAELQQLKKTADANPVKKDEFAGIAVAGKRITDREAAIKALGAALQRVVTPEGAVERFTYRGLEFTLEGNERYFELNSPTGQLENILPAMEKLPSVAGFLTRFANYINRLEPHIADLTAKMAEAKEQAAQQRELANKPFAQAAELEAAREAHKKVQRRLIAKGPDIPVNQRAQLTKELEQQRKGLRAAGFGDALDEFMGSRDAANFAANPARRPGTAQDKAVMRAIADGKSARDVLRLIAGGSKDPFLRQVARLLLKAGITPNIEFGPIGKSKGNPIHGQYRGSNDTIHMAGSAEFAAERIFLHEAMHAATLRALRRKGLHSIQLRKLYEHVKSQQGVTGFYGIKNVDEFVAEVFTNPDFQNALRGINAPSGSMLKTAWDAMVRIMRSILGLSNDAHSALSHALSLGVGVVREDMLLRKNGVSASARANMQDMPQNATGHAQPVDEPVLTPTGWRGIGELQPGDEVFAADGSITQVTGIYPQGKQPVFRVELDDGRWTRATADHLWRLAGQPDDAPVITTAALLLGDTVPVWDIA